METGKISIIGFLVLLLATAVFGGTVELNLFDLGCADTYDINNPYWQTDFELGVTFSEISHVYIDWSGEITAGLAAYNNDPCNPFPLEVGIYAGFSFPFRHAEVWGGEEDYPAPEPFDSLSEIEPSDWLDLLDGQGTITLQYEEYAWEFGVSGGGYIEHGLVVLDDATLIVEGIIVPEPATLFLLGFGGLLLKRRR